MRPAARIRGASTRFPPSWRAVVAAFSTGRLPGAPSTVLDFTGAEPRVLREGAASSADALARVREALR